MPCCRCNCCESPEGGSCSQDSDRRSQFNPLPFVIVLLFTVWVSNAIYPQAEIPEPTTSNPDSVTQQSDATLPLPVEP